MTSPVLVFEELEMQIVDGQWMINSPQTRGWVNLLEFRVRTIISEDDWRIGLLEFMRQEERKLYLEEFSNEK